MRMYVCCFCDYEHKITNLFYCYLQNSDLWILIIMKVTTLGTQLMGMSLKIKYYWLNYIHITELIQILVFHHILT
jgi:hypothetical protein